MPLPVKNITGCYGLQMIEAKMSSPGRLSKLRDVGFALGWGGMGRHPDEDAASWVLKKRQEALRVSRTHYMT